MTSSQCRHCADSVNISTDQAPALARLLKPCDTQLASNYHRQNHSMNCFPLIYDVQCHVK